MSIRTHVSALSEVGAVRPTIHDDSFAECDSKPRGFWYEVNGGWRDWCKIEMPQWIEGRHLHSVDLGETRVLRLEHAFEVEDLCRGFGRRNRWGDKVPDWKAIADKYDGIEIAPYQWECRLSMRTNWYYTWDVASGVIWRPRGVRLVKIGMADDPHMLFDHRNHDEDSEAAK